MVRLLEEGGRSVRQIGTAATEHAPRRASARVKATIGGLQSINMAMVEDRRIPFRSVSSFKLPVGVLLPWVGGCGLQVWRTNWPPYGGSWLTVDGAV